MRLKEIKINDAKVQVRIPELRNNSIFMAGSINGNNNGNITGNILPVIKISLNRLVIQVFLTVL